MFLFVCFEDLLVCFVGLFVCLTQAGQITEAFWLLCPIENRLGGWGGGKQSSRETNLAVIPRGMTQVAWIHVAALKLARSQMWDVL